MTGRAFSPFDAVLDKVPRLGATLRAGTVTATGGRLSVNLAGTVITGIPYLGGPPTVGERIWLLRQGSTLLGFGTIGGTTGGGVTDHSALTGVTTSQHHARYTNAEAVAAVGTPWVGQYLPLAGGTLTGALTLPAANPTATTHAAHKGYVDAAVVAHNHDPTYSPIAHNHDANYSPVAHNHSTLYLPLAGGTLTGALILPAAMPTLATHATNKGYVDQQDALSLLKAGGTMSGFIVLHADPASAMQAATKQYVDTKATSTHNHDAAYSPVAHTHTYLPLAGGTLSGFLTLHADPSSAMHAVTKQYADTKAASGHNHDAAYSPVAHNHSTLYLPLAGGTLTGFLTLHADPTNPMHASTMQYVDARILTRATLVHTHTYLPLAGGTMTGFIVLHADPSSAMHAVTKQYVDNKAPLGGPYLPTVGGTMLGNIFLPAGDPPTMGVHATPKSYVDAGDALKVAKAGDTMTGPLALPAVPPTLATHATSKTYVDTADALKVAKAGDTMTGFLTLHADPDAAMKAATKQYVDSRATAVGTGGHASFMFSAATTEPPTGTQLRLNNATQSSATKLWVMDASVDGLDVTVGLARIMIGHQIYLQDYDDATKWIKFTVTADAIDKGNYFEVGIAHHSGASASPLPVQKIEFQAIAPGQVGVPPGGSAGHVLAKDTVTDWDVSWVAPSPPHVVDPTEPTTPSDGLLWINPLDDGTTDTVGSLGHSPPKGIVAVAQNAYAVGSLNGTSSLGGLTTSFTADGPRIIRVVAKCRIQQNNVSGLPVKGYLAIGIGGTATGLDSSLSEWSMANPAAVETILAIHHAEVASGSHSVTLTLQEGTAHADPIHVAGDNSIVVEDLGAA